MAFWRAPWNTVFAHAAHRNDEDFTIVDAAEATSQLGIQSLASETCDIVDTVPAHGYPWDKLNDEVNEQRAGSIWSGYLPCIPWDEKPDLERGDTFPYHDERLYSTLTRGEATALEHAGRRNEGHTFMDLRSPNKSRRRRRADMEKYYGYQYVKRGQVDQQHKVQPSNILEPRRLATELPSRVLNKQDLFKLAQDWPRPPRYHRSKLAKHYSPWSMSYEARQEARKHSRQQYDLDEAIGLACDIDYEEEVVRRQLDEDLAEREWLQAAAPQAQADHEREDPAMERDQWLYEQKRLYAQLQAEAGFGPSEPTESPSIDTLPS